MSAETRENARWFRDHFTVDGVDLDGHVRATCDAYDPDSRLCTAHDARPPICRRFPHYDNDDRPDPDLHLPAGCSYRWELDPGDPGRGPVVGRLLPLWPVGATGPTPRS